MTTIIFNNFNLIISDFIKWNFLYAGLLLENFRIMKSWKNNLLKLKKLNDLVLKDSSKIKQLVEQDILDFQAYLTKRN